MAASLIVSTRLLAVPAEDASRRMLERVIGSAAAAQVHFTLVSSMTAPPVERFTLSGSAGNILIEATTASALTQGAGWYLKYVVHADLMLRGGAPTLPAVLPAPPAVIQRAASVPHRYVFNDTNDGYTDPNLPWSDWENQLDLMALHGINEVYLTVGTDYVFYQLLQRYGYTAEELRRWIPDAAHQPWWVLQNMSGGDSPISDAQLSMRAELGRRIANRARELGITPVFPGYWGTVPVDFGIRNTGADVIPQDMWVGYQRPSWLNPASPVFKQIAADYYAVSEQVLGASTMYKMDPLHEGGLVGQANLAQAATAIELALRTAHPDATWVILGWAGNPSLDLLAGITRKDKLLLLASEADRYPTWDSAQRWAGVPYAFGSIYNYGGHTILGANAATMVDRWYADMAGANAGLLKGVAILPEAWNANPAVAELLSELPWQPSRFSLASWLPDYAAARYGSDDPHLRLAWAILAETAYATPPDGDPEAQDSLFNAQPGLLASTASPFGYGHMRYSRPDLERAWRELLAGAPAVVQTDSYRFDLADVTRQVIVNRARVLLPKIRRAFETKNHAQFAALTARWLELMRLVDRVEGTHAAFMLGPRLANAIANGTTPSEDAQLVRNVVNLITNWGTEAGFYSGLRDYANRDWNCLTSTYYMPRWATYFNGLQQQLAGGTERFIDWFRYGEDFTNADHSSCAIAPTGDIVAIAQEAAVALMSGPDSSVVPDGWRSFAENEATFGYDGRHFTIESSGADIWQNLNRYGVLYQRGAMHDGVSVTVRVTSIDSQGQRPWARAGLLAGGDVVSSRPTGFANIAITPGRGCVFSWAPDAAQGLTRYLAAPSFVAPVWIRLARVGDTYVGSCSKDGVVWTIVGSSVPGQVEAASDVGMFASAGNGGASDPFVASFDAWNLQAGSIGDKQLAIEYFHSAFSHYFVTSLSEEIAKLDAGAFSGWSRTGFGFQVYTAPAAGRSSVCRLFTTAFPPTSSHFYAPRGLGCEAALANVDWQFEGDVFYSPLPAFDGACPAGTSPVYRLYNNGQGGAPGHRFTTSLAERSGMLANNYISEGTGIGVGMCSPD